MAKTITLKGDRSLTAKRVAAQQLSRWRTLPQGAQRGERRAPRAESPGPRGTFPTFPYAWAPGAAWAGRRGALFHHVPCARAALVRAALATGLAVPRRLPSAPPAAPASLVVPKTCHAQPALPAWPHAHANAHHALEVHLNGSLNAINKCMHGRPSVPNRSIHFPDYLLCFSMGLQAPTIWEKSNTPRI